MNYINELLDFKQPDVGYEDLKGEPICGCCRTYFVVSQEEREKIKEIASDIYEALGIAEAFLDRQNGKHGNETELCLYCHSKEIDGLGITHEEWCPIQKARKALAKAEGGDIQ